MVTGVETAGLVLGSIPLILAGLQFYAEGVMVSRRYLRYKGELEDLIMQLRSENAIYTNTINLLLKGIVQEKDMAAFLASPCGAGWDDVSFDNRLKARLGQTYQSYLDNINKMNSVAEEFKIKLKLTSNGKPQFTEANLFKEHYKRLKFSIKKSDYDDLMVKLRRANFSLLTMTTQISTLESAPLTCKQHRGPTMPKFRTINDRARGFYSALCSGWKCPCHADHTVNLRLEPRMDDVQSDDDSDDDATGSNRDPFHVVFRYNHNHAKVTVNPVTAPPWTWEEADVRIVKKNVACAPKSCHAGTRSVKFADRAQKAVSAALNPALPNLQPIQDLCKAIAALEMPQRDVCLELLATAIAKQKYGFHIYPKDPVPNPETCSLSTLRHVLQDTKFTRQSRVRLAVTLASSVLQLHETPWLDQNWTKDSIFFIKRSDETAYDHPFVSRHFSQNSQVTANNPLPAALSRIIRNQTLYRLGVALIELWYRKPLGELHIPADGERDTGDPQTDLMTEWATADRLIEDLYTEAGVKYADAVRRCIRCDFDHRASNLEHDAFQKAVYEGVVSQLKSSFDFVFQPTP